MGGYKSVIVDYLKDVVLVKQYKFISLIAGLFLLTACGPSIDNLEPGAGVKGDKIVITGGKLTVGKNPIAVDFNGTPATFKAVGNTVQAVVPAGATSGPVHVKTQYVDYLSPGGTAESPFHFNVVSSMFSESENNNTQKAANNAGLSQIIKGSISDTDKADWFKITSGSSGMWGYGVEISVEPINLPAGVSLRLEMQGYRADISAIGNLTTYKDSKPFSLWTTQAPNSDIYLKVDWSGPASGNFKSDYQLKIGRIKIDDTNEGDDDFKGAKQIITVNGQGSHNASYLCNVFKGGTDVGMKDFYYFAGNYATDISVVVVTPPLNQKDAIHVELYDNAKGYRGGNVGNAVVSNFDLNLTGGEKAIGQWYIEVTNAWDHYASAGSGPGDKMPLSCKSPYTIMVIAN